MAGEYSASVGPRPAHALRIDILTVFPEMFVGPLDHSVIGRARSRGLADVRVHNLRDWTTDRHRTTDDYAYGGGGGMVMLAGPIFEAVESLYQMPPISAAEPLRPPWPVVLMTPQGIRPDHTMIVELSRQDRLLIICGHYEGVDERVRLHLATHEISIGDFVVTGGELPAMVLCDAVIRLLPGVVGNATATETDSFATGLLEHPHYSRPADFRGWPVPEVLRSGNHRAIAAWRRREALRRTLERRPDWLAKAQLSPLEKAWLLELQASRCDPKGRQGPAAVTGAIPGSEPEGAANTVLGS